jgi:aspartate/methionine/tyrosine aminotransferase
LGKFITNIDDLERHINSETIFLSGWDKEPSIMNISPLVIATAANGYINKYNSYFFMSECDGIKKDFFSDILFPSSINLSADNIAIAPNGTSAIFLSILSIKNKFNISNVLLISPIYFSIINVIQMLNMNLYYYKVNIHDSDIFNFDKLKSFIINKKIELVIVTDPLFGTGIPISLENYNNIISIAKRLGVWIIFDYVYGGMEWNLPVSIVNKYLVETIIDYPNIIVVESISKRLFLNGIKFSIIYSNTNIIHIIEDLSESFIGSYSYIQNELFMQIYKPTNKTIIIEQIIDNIENIKQTFFGVKSALLGKNIFISDCSSGYFALMGIPIRELKGLTEAEFAVSIVKKFNILTIPHSRYLFKDDDYYYFRINLSMDKAKLIMNINKLLDTYLY